MSKANTTLVICPQEAIPTLWVYLQSSRAQTAEKFVSATLALCDASDEDLTTAQAISDKADISVEIVRARLRDLTKKGYAASEKARDRFSHVEDHRTNCIVISSPKKAEPKLPASQRSNRNKHKQTVDNLERGGVYDLERIDKESAKDLQAYQLPTPEEVKRLFAPGNAQRRSTSVTVRSKLGLKKNSAVSAYGVINSYDSIVLNAWQTLTMRYVSRLPAHYLTKYGKDLSIPIWTDDVIRITAGIEPRTPQRRKVSMACLRIKHTDFSLHVDSIKPLLVGKENIPGAYFDFRFLANMLIPSSQTVSEDLEEYSFESESGGEPTESDYEARAKEIYGSDFPFNCVLIRWDSGFFERVASTDTTHVLSSVNLQLPPILSFLVEMIKLDYFKQKTLFPEGNVSSHLLVDLFKYLWPKEKDESLTSLTHQFQSEVKSLKKTHPELVDIDQDNKNIVTIIVKGISFYIEFVNFEKQRKNNRNSVVGIHFDSQALLEGANAKVVPGEENPPMQLNPLTILNTVKEVELDEHPKLLSNQTRNISKAIKNQKLGLYTVEFSILSEEFCISRYVPPTRLSIIYQHIAELANCDIFEVELYFSELIVKLKDIEGISFELVYSLAKELEVSASEIVKYISSRTRYLDRIKRDNFQELRTVFA